MCTRAPAPRGSRGPGGIFCGHGGTATKRTPGPRLPRGAGARVHIGSQNSLICSISIHNPVPDSLAARPVATKHDLPTVARPGRFITIDAGWLVGQLFPVGAVSVHHPDISV